MAVTLGVEWYSRLIYDYDNNMHAAMTRTSKAISGIMPATGWHTLSVSIQHYTQTFQNKLGQSDSANKLCDQSSVQLQVFVMLSPSTSPHWQTMTSSAAKAKLKSLTNHDAQPGQWGQVCNIQTFWHLQTRTKWQSELLWWSMQHSWTLQVFALLRPSTMPEWQWPRWRLRQRSSLWPWWWSE